MPDFGGIDKKLNKQEKPVESEEQRESLLFSLTPLLCPSASALRRFAR